MIIIPQQALLLSYTSDPEQLIERAGRTCYKSEAKITEESAPDFVRMICRRHHVSVIEHAVATFMLTTDRGITHELVRHRLASFSQESTRYVNYYKKGEIRVIEPIGLTEAQREVWLRAVMDAEQHYNQLVNAGCKPEQARDVLPTCLAADIAITANFREWKHIISLRTSPAAHPKIRLLIGEVHRQLTVISPTIFGPDADDTDHKTS